MLPHNASQRAHKEEKRPPMVLIIMDGLAYGATAPACGNAVLAAHTPVLDALTERWPHARLEASGQAVGLPDGQMGNSEVGHLNIGAGSTVYQELTRIDRAIADETFFDNEELKAACAHCGATGGTLHLMGLVSNGGVHSEERHLFALLELARREGVSDVAIHCFLDGRDTPPSSGRDFVKALLERCQETGVGIIQTIVGRYYAMDRDKRWERVSRAYDALTCGAKSPQGVVVATDPLEAIQNSYDSGVTDEFVEPIVLGDKTIGQDDSVIFFNFRPDRAREITRAFVDDDFEGFARTKTPHPYFVCMTEYDATIKAPIAFPKEHLKGVLADVLSSVGLRQFHIAETEKYAHVTFFFNGGVEQPKEGEERVIIPSPNVATYDLQPEMSAREVGSRLRQAISSDEADVYICNFANGDMVGHTGDYDAAIKAVETVDSELGEIVALIEQLGGTILITADHGNAEQMLDDDGKTPLTAHTCNTVPFLVVNSKVTQVKDGALCDVAPTLLTLMGVEVPRSWTGRNLVVY